MANEKILNTRIQLKYDSYANWQTNNPTLKAGELAIAYLGPTHTTTTPNNDTHPVLFKIGPGAFNDLPWASALAADVYSWAKLTEAQFIDGFLAMKATDGSTIQSKLDAIFATDEALTQAISAVREEITNLSVSALEARVKAIEDDYLKAADIANMATDEEVEAAIKVETDRALAAEEALGKRIDAIDFIDSDELTEALNPYAKSGDISATYETIANVDLVRNRVTELENHKDDYKAYADQAEADAIEAAANDAASKYATTTALEAVANTANNAKERIDTFLDSEDISGAVDTLVELNKYITEDTAAFTGLSERVTKLENGTTPAAKAEDANKLGGVAAADYLLKTDAPGYNDILTKTVAADTYQPKGDYATAAQGAKADTAVQPAALASYYTKEEANAEFMNSTEVDDKINALNLATTYEPIGAEIRAKNYADSLANNYATAAQGEKADNALQTISAGTGLKVSAKADNSQTIDIDESVVFVFNCGDSKTLID